MKRIPFLFIKRLTRLSWGEAAWGYHNQYIGWVDATELACDRIVGDEVEPAVIELAGISKSDASEVGYYLDKLAKGVEYDEKEMKAKWLYLSLAWCFENRALLPDPFEVVEEIYSDFEYSEDVAPFVRYMPVTDGYDPSANSAEENHSRLLSKWRDYLVIRSPKFADHPKPPSGPL